MKRVYGVVLGLVCIILAVSLGMTVIQFTSTINEKDNTITAKVSAITDLQTQLTEKEDTIVTLNAYVTNRDLQIENLTIQNTQLQLWLDANRTTVDEQNETIFSLNAAIEEKDTQIQNLEVEKNTLSNQITEQQILQNQIDNLSNTVTDMQQNETILQNKVTVLEENLSSADGRAQEANARADESENKLTSVINLEVNNLQTLAFHVCSKDWIQAPNITDVYSQIQALNSGNFSVLLLPEYFEHQDWPDELAWLNSSFGGPQGIPIMLDVFASVENDSLLPTQLFIKDIQEARAVCNVQYLRFAEVISWHQERSVTFPMDYVKPVLDFCRNNSLKLYWTEWKQEAFAAIQTYIAGYEDIVTVSFSTNSEFVEPGSGCLHLSNTFEHWGASVQSWYAAKREGNETTMPESLLVQHALVAKNMGAEVIEFEPYWYFFDQEKAKWSLQLLEAMLK